MIKPPALREGDRIAMVAPASPFDREEFERGLTELRSFGLEPVFDLITGGHDSGLAKPEFGLIFYQNPEVFDYRDTVQNKKIGVVVVPVDDYLSI